MSDLGMTGEFARSIGARHLILTHLSQRFFTRSQLVERSKKVRNSMQYHCLLVCITIITRNESVIIIL